MPREKTKEQPYYDRTMYRSDCLQIQSRKRNARLSLGLNSNILMVLHPNLKFTLLDVASELVKTRGNLASLPGR